MSLKLCVVTATTNVDRASSCIESWGLLPLIIQNDGGGGQYRGVVPSFRLGVDTALTEPEHYDLIACLHDDLEISDPHWVERVCQYFAQNPAMGLAGFGGAVGLGDDDLYQSEYRPQQLARKGFRSNLVDAEVHGMRSLLPERVACLDGFSQIGRRAFWLGDHGPDYGAGLGHPPWPRPWTELESIGVVHHLYDGLLGCLAARHGWETWYLPIACRHYGGRTAVGDEGYHAWAAQFGGDHGLWKQAHRIGYDAFRDVLPLRV